jgi:hypothetical protein
LRKGGIEVGKVYKTGAKMNSRLLRTRATRVQRNFADFDSAFPQKTARSWQKTSLVCGIAFLAIPHDSAIPRVQLSRKPRAPFMTIPLWPHQEAAITAAREHLAAGGPSGLWVMPTGTGKTVAFCTLAARIDLPALVVVHRDELVRQTLRTLGLCWPSAAAGVVQAERTEWRERHAVVGMVQSLRTRLDTIPADRFGLLVIDEAHHAPADSYRLVAGHFRPRFRLGCTATPERLDGQGLDDLFGDKPLYVYELKQAIEDGHLVRIRQYAIATAVSLDGMASRGGDFAPEALGQAVLQAGRTRAVVEAYRDYGEGRKALPGLPQVSSQLVSGRHVLLPPWLVMDLGRPAGERVVFRYHLRLRAWVRPLPLQDRGLARQPCPGREGASGAGNTPAMRPDNVRIGKAETDAAAVC